MNQGLVNVVLSDSMPDVTLFLLLTPLRIETMELTCDISMVYQIKSLPEILHFKITAEMYMLTLPLKAKKSKLILMRIRGQTL